MTHPPLTRREFLFWSGALGASAALPLGWMAEEPVRLGFVGLGGRGLQALSVCQQLPAAKVVALCDRKTEALRSAVAGPGALAGLATREARRLFDEPAVDAVILAASEKAQLDLASEAVAAGKDVFLLRPLPFDPSAWKDIASEGARRQRQIQMARKTGFALEPGAAGGLLSKDGALAGAEVEARFQSPERPDARALVGDLLDEIDFAQAVLGGRVKRVVQVGGPGILPGRWIDQRMHFEIVDEQGVHRWMGITLIATRGPGAKASRILVRGDRGAAELAGSPLPPGDPQDLGLFLDAVRSREAGAGLSLSRSVELTEKLQEVSS
ncbi:MAG TPA: Gfo/Idh/MocA family oxidoreductase [Thermoanaerobaculia bacterium]